MTTAPPARPAAAAASGSGNLLLRNDTMFGVCQAIGEDFGFNPNWLRIALALSFYFAPLAVVGFYIVLGVAVAATRWRYPAAPIAAMAAEAVRAGAARHASANQGEPVATAIAA